MNVLFNNFLTMIKDKKYPYNETLLLYKTIAMLYPQEMKQFFEDNLKDEFEQRQCLVREILQGYSFRIYPELSMIKLEDKAGNKIQDKIVNLFDEIEKNDNKDLGYYLEVGFWLDKTNFELYQISACFPAAINK